MGNKLISKLCISDDANNLYDGAYSSNEDVDDLYIHSNYNENIDDDSNEGMSCK